MGLNFQYVHGNWKKLNRKMRKCLVFIVPYRWRDDQAELTWVADYISR